IVAFPMAFHLGRTPGSSRGALQRVATMPGLPGGTNGTPRRSAGGRHRRGLPCWAGPAPAHSRRGRSRRGWRMERRRGPAGGGGNGEGADRVAKEIDGLAYAVDVTDYDALRAAVDDAAATLGGLSTVFNNAGGSNLSQIHEWPGDEWERIVGLNLGGVFHGIK